MHTYLLYSCVLLALCCTVIYSDYWGLLFGSDEGLSDDDAENEGFRKCECVIQ